MKQQHLSVVMLESPHFTIVSVPFVGITLVNSEITLTQTQLAASIYSPPMPSAFNFLTTSLLPFLPLYRGATLFKLCELAIVINYTVQDSLRIVCRKHGIFGCSLGGVSLRCLWGQWWLDGCSCYLLWRGRCLWHNGYVWQFTVMFLPHVVKHAKGGPTLFILSKNINFFFCIMYLFITFVQTFQERGVMAIKIVKKKS